MDRATEIGFKGGYDAAINNKPRHPELPLAVTLALSGFMSHYFSGYEEGYTKGKSDRALLLQGREQNEELSLQNNFSHERNDV